jgi:hypothetical protein
MSLRFPAFMAVLVLAACVSHTPTDPGLGPGTVPTPAPSPTPLVARLACGVGPGPGDGLEEHCPRTSPGFQAEVDAAIDRVVVRHSELLDLADSPRPGVYAVRNIDEYFRQVVQEIAEGSRLCAMVDADLEIAVKRDNALSDQYKLMGSSGYMRRGDNLYRVTCVPAWF